MLQHAAVVERQVILLIGDFLRRLPRKRVKHSALVGEFKTVGIQQWRALAIGLHRPELRIPPLQPLIAHASEKGGDARRFGHNLRRMRIAPVVSHAGGKLGENAPVRSAITKRLQRLVKALNAPLGVDVGALFFHAGAGWQHYVGELRRAAEEEILHHQKIEVGKTLVNAGGVGVGKGGLFANHIHGANLFRARVLNHLEVIRARLQRQPLRLDAPGARPLRAHALIGYRLVAGVVIFQAAEVACPLHVVVAAHRVAAGAGPAIVAGHQQQVRERGAGIGTVAVLGNTHRPDDADGACLTDQLGGGSEFFNGKPRDLRCEFQREGRQRLAILLHLVDPLSQKRLVGIAVIKHIAGHRRGPYHVSAGTGAQVQVGALGHLMTARVDDQQLLTVMLFRCFQLCGDYRVVFSCIAADDDHQVRLLQILYRARVAAVAYGAE